METKETHYLKEVIKNLHAEKDPELLKRIQERSKALRERVLMAHGVPNVAADFIREGRDE